MIARKFELAFGALLLIAIGIGGWYGLQYLRSSTVSREDDGDVVSKVIYAKLESAEDLRVKKLTGTVQGAVCVDRMWGFLHPCRVMKAPFSVDYYVDLHDLDRSDFRWNADRHILLVNVPDVRVGAVNVDESRTSYDSTSGPWVSRGAMAELRRKSSIRAHQVTGDEAKKAENVDAARRAARKALSRYFDLPLETAGVSAQVEIRFPIDRVASDEVWDVSRPLNEVLGIVR